MAEATVDPVGTVRVHPDDDRLNPGSRRRIAVDASDYAGPYEGCRWQRLTGVGVGDGGCDPLHSRDVAGWPVQPLAELAVVLGHPAVDGDLRERLVDAVLDVLAHGDVATQQEGSERLADVMLAIVRPVLERQGAEIADHSRAAEIDEGTKAELAEENAGLCAEVARLAAELASERAVYADSPGDRLWHDADQTWWRRAEDGRLVRGEAPLEVKRLTRERDDALTALDDLERQRDAWWNQRAAEREALSRMLRGMARRATTLRRERNLARSSRDQYHRNWDRCREANGTALQTISALKLDRIALSGLLRGMARRVSGQRRSKERLAMWAEGRRPAIPADAEMEWKKWISDSIQYGRDISAHPDFSAEVMWEKLKPFMRVASADGADTASYGQRYEQLGYIPAGRYYLTIGVEVGDNRNITSRFDVPGGVNIRGFWESHKTRIEPVPVSGSDTTPPSMPELAKIVYCGATEGYTGVDCQLEADHGRQPHEGRWIDPKNEDNWLFVQWPTDKARAEARQVGVAS